jgi:HPt (histidine-containing phosphotransfer) domain-containing protein
MSDETPILDENVIGDLLESVGGDKSFIAELATAYLTESPEHLRQMTEAVARSDVDAVVRPAHTLKSSSAALGAARLSEISRGIEHAAREGRAEGLDAAVADAQAAWEKTVAAINERRLVG